MALHKKLGEILVSEHTINAAGLDKTGMEKRQLDLKGHQKKITAYVLHAGI